MSFYYHRDERKRGRERGWGRETLGLTLIAWTWWATLTNGGKHLLLFCPSFFSLPSSTALISSALIRQRTKGTWYPSVKRSPITPFSLAETLMSNAPQQSVLTQTLHKCTEKQTCFHFIIKHIQNTREGLGILSQVLQYIQLKQNFSHFLLFEV